MPAEIGHLVTAAQNERADALGEILSQANEFISYFLNLMTAAPGAYPQTTKLLSIASLVGTFVAMYYKAQYARPRPSELCPALLPPIAVPGRAGRARRVSTQFKRRDPVHAVQGHGRRPAGVHTRGLENHAHLMALCMNDVLNGLPQQRTMVDNLWTLADRIARNREIAGLHYESDTAAGVAIARSILPLLATTARYQTTRDAAKLEWQ